MKALTVHQPSAWALVAGEKVVENRTRRLPERMIGQRVLIHAGKPAPDEGMIAWMVTLGLRPPGKPSAWWTTSAIIGEVTLMACVHRVELRSAREPTWEWMMDGVQMEQLRTWSSLDAGGGPDAPWCWLIGQAVAYEQPIQGVGGQQGFWTYQAGAAGRPVTTGRTQ